jgi:drug/metabolite transporter (DMT)-like permease
VPLSSWILLNEAISSRRWLGIALICAGVVITARQVGQVEERL